jgi:hypothetical protein
MKRVYTRRIPNPRHIHVLCSKHQLDRLKKMLGHRNIDLSSFVRDLLDQALADYEKNTADPINRSKKKEPLPV